MRLAKIKSSSFYSIEMSAYLNAIGAHPATHPISGTVLAFREHNSPLIRASSGARHGVQKHHDALSDAWHAVSTGVKANITRVEDGLDSAWSYVSKGVKDVYNYRQHVFQELGDDLKSVYDYRAKVFGEAGHDVAAAYHGAGTVLQTAADLPYAATFVGGLGGSFLTLAGLVALYLFFKA